MHTARRRALCSALSILIFATNCVFLHSTEVNFYSDQRARLQFAAVLAQLSSPYGSVRSVVSPSNADPAKFVIHVQDIHQNYEAQFNISQTIQKIRSTGFPGLVALEGHDGEIDLTRLQSFESQQSVRTAADYLLRENKLVGPVHAALVQASAPLSYIGVDDSFHYRQNIAAYRAARESKPQLFRKWRAADRELQRLMSRTLNHRLANFQNDVNQARSGADSISAHLEPLVRQGADLGPNMKLFLTALRLEKTLDAARAEKERARFLSSARTTPIDFALYPALGAFSRYASISNRIDTGRLLQEIEQAEQNTFKTLIRTPAEAVVIHAFQRLFLARKLLDFELTTNDWIRYQQTASTDISNTVPEIASYETFYREANVRDIAMADNTLRALKNHHVSAAILVTGGFHSAHLDSRLRDAGYTVITFVPKLTHLDKANASAYLGVFAQNKTPLEKLVDGERLFLSPDPVDGLKLMRPMVAAQVALHWPAEKTRELNLKIQRVLDQLKMGGGSDVELTLHEVRVNTAAYGRRFVQLVLSEAGEPRIVEMVVHYQADAIQNVTATFWRGGASSKGLTKTLAAFYANTVLARVSEAHSAIWEAPLFAFLPKTGLAHNLFLVSLHNNVNIEAVIARTLGTLIIEGARKPIVAHATFNSIFPASPLSLQNAKQAAADAERHLQVEQTTQERKSYAALLRSSVVIAVIGLMHLAYLTFSQPAGFIHVLKTEPSLIAMYGLNTLITLFLYFFIMKKFLLNQNQQNLNRYSANLPEITTEPTENKSKKKVSEKTPILQQAARLLSSAARSSSLYRPLYFIAGVELVAILASMICEVRWMTSVSKATEALVAINATGFYVAILFCLVISVLVSYLNHLQNWLCDLMKNYLRVFITMHLVSEWLTKGRAARLKQTEIGLNPDQRIQEDATQVANQLIDLGMRFFQTTLRLLFFCIALSYQPGGIYMILASFVYSGMGLMITGYVGNRLEGLNASFNERNGELRTALRYADDHSDEMAHNSDQEQRIRALVLEKLDDSFASTRRISAMQKQLTWITAQHGWLASLLALIIAAPGFFWGHFTIANLTFIAGAFGSIQGSFRSYIDAVPGINALRASLKRVGALNDALTDLAQKDAQEDPRVVRARSVRATTQLGRKTTNAQVKRKAVASLTAALNDETDWLTAQYIVASLIELGAHPSEHLPVFDQWHPNQTQTVTAIMNRLLAKAEQDGIGHCFDAIAMKENSYLLGGWMVGHDLNWLQVFWHDLPPERAHQLRSDYQKWLHTELFMLGAEVRNEQTLFTETPLANAKDRAHLILVWTPGAQINPPSPEEFNDRKLGRELEHYQRRQRLFSMWGKRPLNRFDMSGLTADEEALIERIQAHIALQAIYYGEDILLTPEELALLPSLQTKGLINTTIDSKRNPLSILPLWGSTQKKFGAIRGKTDLDTVLLIERDKDAFNIVYDFTKSDPFANAGLWMRTEPNYLGKGFSFDYKRVNGPAVSIEIEFISHGKSVEHHRLVLPDPRGTIAISRSGKEALNFDQLNMMVSSPQETGQIQIANLAIDRWDGTHSTVSLKGNIPLDRRFLHAKDRFPTKIANNLVPNGLQTANTYAEFAAALSQLVGSFNQASVVAQTALTRDGIDITADGVEHRNWTSAAKESLHIALLGLALERDHNALLTVANHVFVPVGRRMFSWDNLAEGRRIALATLTLKMDSYEKFDRMHPEFAGFLPWLNPETLEPTEDWKDRVPSLDNGELLWSIYYLVHTLREAGEAGLADRYEIYLNRAASNVARVFYEGDGRIRTEAKIHREWFGFSYSDNQPGHYLDDAHEGLMMVLFMLTFTTLGSEDATRIVARIRGNLLRQEVLTSVVTDVHNTGSAHEEWGSLFLPYNTHPILGKLRRNMEIVRGYYSLSPPRSKENPNPEPIPGFRSAANTWDPVEGVGYPILGMGQVAREKMRDMPYVSPMGIVPLLQMDFEMARRWFQVVFPAPLVTRYGLLDSIRDDWTNPAPVATSDVNYSAELALLGGISAQNARFLARERHASGGSAHDVLMGILSDIFEDFSDIQPSSLVYPSGADINSTFAALVRLPIETRQRRWLGAIASTHIDVSANPIGERAKWTNGTSLHVQPSETERLSNLSSSGVLLVGAGQIVPLGRGERLWNFAKRFFQAVTRWLAIAPQPSRATAGSFVSEQRRWRAAA